MDMLKKFLLLLLIANFLSSSGAAFAEIISGPDIAVVEVEGGGAKAQALADKVSKVWVDFARTGNPGWEAYTRDKVATMIIDDEFALAYHHDAELMKLLMPDYEY